MKIITKTPILNNLSAKEKREEILQYFHDTYDIDEELYKTLKRKETFYLRADPLRHPLIFYYGHTAAFFMNKLILAKIVSERINPAYESMFAVGVDEMSWDDLNDAHYDWPTVNEVKKYRDLVRGKVDDLIRTMPLEMPITWDSPFWVILMGIEHERIHLETSSVLIRQLPLSEVKSHPLFSICEKKGKAPQNQLLHVEGQNVILGKQKNDQLYGWDNEFGHHETEVKSFKASKYLVSNEEFYDFICDDGYKEKKYWTEEGWNWKNFKKAEYPLFWEKTVDDFKLRTMTELISMPWNWPVVVNYLEAKAFCNWKAEKTGKSIRMPTEDEWYCLRDQLIATDQPYWKKAPGNINLEYWASSCPVDQFAFGNFYDVIGNVWQWMENPIYAFKGFEVHPYYDDFTVPTYDGKHNLIKGGSWISTGNEATHDARYAFRRHFYQHAGFRYIESSEPVKIIDETYETDAVISSYCDMQYGEVFHGIENFSIRIMEKVTPFLRHIHHEKALNIGCKVGRTTFEMAKIFNHVTGLDFTARMIQIPTKLKEQGKIRYVLQTEGELESFHEKQIGDFESIKEKVHFSQADASNLLEKYYGYDFILVENALEEMYDPENFLKMIHTRINDKGILALASTYQWNESFTKKEKWIGGIRKDGEPLFAIETIDFILKENFTLLEEPIDIPFLKIVNNRKYEFLLSQLTIWMKK